MKSSRPEKFRRQKKISDKKQDKQNRVLKNKLGRLAFWKPYHNDAEKRRNQNARD